METKPDKSEKKSPYEKPIKLDTNLYWNQSWYIIAEPKQTEYRLIGIKVEPPRQVTFKLRDVENALNILEVYDFECSLERDEAKYLKWKDKHYGDTEGDV